MTLESSLAALAGLRHRLDVEGPSETLLAAVREQVEALPADAPEICRAFGAQVLKGVESAPRARRRPVVEIEPGEIPVPGEDVVAVGPEELEGEEVQLDRGRAAAAPSAPTPISQAYDREVQAIANLGVRLPLRAPAVNIPGHVTPLPETHGLVHGGVIQAHGFRLVVKAFRFQETRKEGLSYRQVSAVAGVCDRIDDDGKRSTWSTAQRLKQWYASTSAVLPAPPYALIPGGSHGFYRPAYLMRWLLSNGLKGPTTPLQDDGLPDPLFYTGKVLRVGTASRYSHSAFREAPPPATSLENALFISNAGGNSGFLIDTPYVSVFSLGPDTSSVIVTLPRVFREATTDQNGTITHFVREANPGWEARLFSA